MEAFLTIAACYPTLFLLIHYFSSEKKSVFSSRKTFILYLSMVESLRKRQEILNASLSSDEPRLGGIFEQYHPQLPIVFHGIFNKIIKKLLVR